MLTVLVLGGYGFFGGRISAALSKDSSIRLLIGGRNGDKARQSAQALKLSADAGIEIDCTDAGFSAALRRLGVRAVIHTAGPFQGQNYAVARAAIEAGSHYIDLADGRRFVSGIRELNDAARSRGVAVISGASSVPALSSAVVERYRAKFGRLESLEIGISSGARTPGLATVKGIFSYCGKEFSRLERGHWVKTRGWLDLRRHRFPPPVGARFVGSCDVPDLDLLPTRFPEVQTVTFHAGFASDLGHLVVWSIAALVGRKIFSSAVPFAASLNRISRWIEPLVSDKGGMFVRLTGRDHSGNAKSLTWHVIAQRNHGPHIPCAASIALVQKLRDGNQLPPGAQPCVGLLTVEEYLAPLHGLEVRELIDE